MLRHAILINLKPDTTPEAMQQLVENVRTLPAQVPQIRSWEVGIGLRPSGATVGIVGLFEGLEAFTEYQASDAHHHCAQTYIAPHLEGATQIQFELPGDLLAETFATSSPVETREQE